MNLQLYNVAPRIPEELQFLETLANNIWWCWHPQAVDLFTRINSYLWRELSGNAKTYLRRVSQQRLEELSHDHGYLRLLHAVRSEFEKQVPAEDNFPARSIAYFSLEFGIHESIPIFSGGLGVLAGDHLKAASDLKLPLAGVGLLYRQGYFRQVLDRSGYQTEHYPVSEIHDLPIRRAKDASGKEITISVPLIDRQLYAAVWILPIGNVPLVLLDAEIPENPPELRSITWRLYGGDKTMRLRQELLLGIGGIKALLALGCEPQVCHMNEGHAGFLSLARIAHLVRDRGYEPNVALETVWRSNVFTTHTPVPAGNEVFPIDLIRPYINTLAAEAGLDPNRIINWGIAIGERDRSQEISMTIFGLRLAANYCNGVSKLHGEVARSMWKHLWPQRSVAEIPIRHITNGVHIRSWVSARLGVLFDQYLPPRWAENPSAANFSEMVQGIPDEELWMAHELCRQSLIRRSRRWMQYSLRGMDSRGDKLSQILQPDVLTVGFARRFATYKRGTLLLRDRERLLTLLRDTRHPIQFIFAGKAHPADEGGKQLIRDLIQFAREEKVQDKFIFLENYDIGMARALVQGVDVWLNTPRRPQEASGTSGMKAAINGVINCSILDGWWAEGYNGRNGWAIGGNEFYNSDDDRDNFECRNLLDLLENEIIPCFYERTEGELPTRWIARMKESIITGLGRFSSTRMVQEYDRDFYRPAVENYKLLTADNAARARELVGIKNKLNDNFSNGKLSISFPEVVGGKLENIHVGDSFKVRTWVHLGDLQPSDVEVDAYYGTVDAHNEMIASSSEPMVMAENQGNGNYVYECTVECRQAGRFGLTARIKAGGTAWDNSIPSFMCWPVQK